MTTRNAFCFRLLPLLSDLELPPPRLCVKTDLFSALAYILGLSIPKISESEDLVDHRLLYQTMLRAVSAGRPQFVCLYLGTIPVYLY
ncbi:hypothetical protein B0H12DRAFT_1091954 [Mycena haematopus]|nr:hypothetical protein B0H12DRAFT_1091954 [Mycena haematopus]